MNIFLWILQGLLSFHTLMGAGWKFSHTAEQTMPSLKAIPSGVWRSLIAAELLCGVGLVLPGVVGSMGFLVAIAAAVVAAEMLLFSGVHLASGESKHGPVGYWLVVAALCGLVAYGRLMLNPF